MNDYKYSSHPLAKLSEGRELAPASREDQTPPEFPKNALRSNNQRMKRAIGTKIYPWKNRLERPRVEKRLREIGAWTEEIRSVDSIVFGQKGFSNEILLSSIRPQIARPQTAICFGCGTGYEVLEIAFYLRPQTIVGLDYFNHERAWKYYAEIARARWNVRVEFEQADLRRPPAARQSTADILLSNAVLEHLRDMDQSFAYLKQLLKPSGIFAAAWGPLWHSYGGDHIATELGFEKGFEQVLLSSDEYLRFYKQHPRNAGNVQRGVPTWLELGLTNFARYSEYIESIQRYFGRIQWQQWQICPEAFQWRSQFPERWQQILDKNPQLNPLDLVLQGMACLAGPVN